MNKFKKILNITLLLSAAIVSSASFALDWSGVPSTKIPLYYPGQTGMEWILNKREHDGAARYKKWEKKGKYCITCHEGDEASFGPNQVKGKTDTNPYPGRRGFETVEAQASYDASNFYIRLTWPQNRRCR